MNSRRNLSTPATFAWILLIELAIVVSLSLAFAYGSGGMEAGLGNPEDLLSATTLLVLYIVGRTVLAYLVALLVARAAGDAFATVMSFAAALLAAGYVFQLYELEVAYVPMALGAAVLAYLCTYFVALGHQPSSLRRAPPPPSERETTPVAVAASMPAGRRVRPVHHTAVTATFVAVFLYSGLAMLKVYDMTSLRADPHLLFQWAGLSLLLAFSCAELVRRRNAASLLMLACAVGLLLVDLARHGNLLVQRTGAPWLSGLSSGYCAVSGSSAPDCQITLFTVEYTPWIVSALCAVFALLLAARLVRAMVRSRR